MSRLIWDQADSRFYETGLSRGVLYLSNGRGVAWNGLTSLEEDVASESAEAVVIDGVKVRDVESVGDYEATLRAFTYPDEFLPYEGSPEILRGFYATHQPPKQFSLSYRTEIGETANEKRGHKLHIVYNVLAVPEPVLRTTDTNEKTLTDFSWRLLATPVDFPGARPTAHIYFDSRYLDPMVMSHVEDVLYGTAETRARLLDMAELVNEASRVRIVDNGDGTWTAFALDDSIVMVNDHEFQINNVDVTYLDANTYTIRST